MLRVTSEHCDDGDTTHLELAMLSPEIPEGARRSLPVRTGLPGRQGVKVR